MRDKARTEIHDLSCVDHNAISYSSAGVNNVPLCVKWMLVFEEYETHTLWLGKARLTPTLHIKHQILKILCTQSGKNTEYLQSFLIF